MVDHKDTLVGGTSLYQLTYFVFNVVLITITNILIVCKYEQNMGQKLIKRANLLLDALVIKSPSNYRTYDLSLPGRRTIDCDKVNNA